MGEEKRSKEEVEGKYIIFFWGIWVTLFRNQVISDE
jgi:hypothetical protein